MNGQRAAIYAVITMSIVGIAVVGFLIFKFAPANESFSELYFDNQEQLPDKIRVGEEEGFAFTVVSHESDKASYQYAVKFDHKAIKQGTFTLLPQEEETIDIEFTVGESSMIFVDSRTEVYTSHFRMDSVAGVTWPGEETEASVPILRVEDDVVILPINFSYDGVPGSTILLRINTGSKDSFHFSFTRKQDVKCKGEEAKTPEIPSFTRVGYDLTEEDQTITNDRGKITFTRKIVKSQYRYEKKKVSVEVSANGKEYEIHFWTVVEELPELKKQERG